MPRRSSASFGLVSVNGPRPRLPTPPELTEIERKVFTDTVLAAKSEAFLPTDLPFLAAYAKAVIAEIEAAAELARAPVVDGKPSPWLQVHNASLKAMLSLARKLRLGPLGRNPSLPTRPSRPLSYYEELDLRAEADGEETAQ
jgi:hypothetical protein